ncbi:TonB-dependent receptor [Myxococcota bacterium]
MGASAPNEVQPTQASAAIGVVVAGEPPARSTSEVVRDRRLLEAAPRRSGSDLLATVPGLFITRHGGEGKAHQIFLRGFDAVHGQDLEVWVAGAPANDVSNLHGQGYTDLHFVIPEVVQRIQALPGTYHPEQGDFAVAGTVRYDLGNDRPGLTVKQGLGQYGGRRSLLVVRPSGSASTSFAALELFHTDGFGPARAADRLSAMGQTTWQLAGGLGLRVMGSHYAGRFDSAGVLPLRQIERQEVQRVDVLITGQGGASERQQVVVELVPRRGPQDWRMASYAVRRSLALRHNFTGWLENPVQGDTTQQRNDASTAGLTARYAQRVSLLSARDRWGAGIDLRSDWITQRQTRMDGSGTASSALIDADIRTHRIGGYVDLGLHPVSRVVVRTAVRADGLAFLVDDRTAGGEGERPEAPASRSSLGNHWGVKSTVDVGLVAGLHALASYGDGFRSPQARSLGHGELAPFTTVRSTEVGVRWRPDGHYAARLAAFATWLSDDLVFEHATGRNERVPGTFRSGAAADLVARMSGLATSASFTFSRAVFRGSSIEYQKGFLLPYAPQVVARTESSGRVELTEIRGSPLVATVGVGLTLQARRPLPFGEFGHDVFLADAKLGFEWRPLELELDIFNLLDAQWYDGEFVYASSFDAGGTSFLVPQRHVTMGSPRTVWGVLGVQL